MFNAITKRAKKGLLASRPHSTQIDSSTLPSPTGSSTPFAGSEHRPPPLFPVFGAPLRQAVANSRSYEVPPTRTTEEDPNSSNRDDHYSHLPLVVRLCIEFVEQGRGGSGLEQEGIYRISPSKPRLDELEALVDETNVTELNFVDAHEAAGLLKRFLFKLPEHILTDGLRARFQAAAAACSCDLLANGGCGCGSVAMMRELLNRLPLENYHLLGAIFRHSRAVISHEAENKMGVPALGLLLQATLNMHGKKEVLLFLLSFPQLFPSLAADQVDYGIATGSTPLSQKSGLPTQPHRPIYRRPMTLEEVRSACCTTASIPAGAANNNPPSSSGIPQNCFHNSEVVEKELARQRAKMEDFHRRVNRAEEEGKSCERWQRGLRDAQEAVRLLEERANLFRSAEKTPQPSSQPSATIIETTSELPATPAITPRGGNEGAKSYAPRTPPPQRPPPPPSSCIAATATTQTAIKSGGGAVCSSQITAAGGKQPLYPAATANKQEEELSPALREKHLLAAQHTLHEEIAEEKRRIGQLLSKLRELNVATHSPGYPQLPSPTTPQQQQNGCHMPMPTPTTEVNKYSPAASAKTLPGGVPIAARLGSIGSTAAAAMGGGHSRALSTSNLEALYAAEESKKQQLLAEVTRLRNLCAELRARLEQETMALATITNGGQGGMVQLTSANAPPPPAVNEQNEQGEPMMIVVAANPMNEGEKEKGEENKEEELYQQQQQPLLITRF